MRTTLDIEDEMLQAAKELARREGGTVGQVISTLARRGLADSPAKPKKSTGARNGVPLLASRCEVVTLERIQKLMAQEGIKGIALTGYGMKEDIARSEAVGFSTHLIKPIRVQSLEEALAKAAPPFSD